MAQLPRGLADKHYISPSPKPASIQRTAPAALWHGASSKSSLVWPKLGSLHGLLRGAASDLQALGSKPERDKNHTMNSVPRGAGCETLRKHSMSGLFYFSSHTHASSLLRSLISMTGCLTDCANFPYIRSLTSKLHLSKKLL